MKKIKTLSVVLFLLLSLSFVGCNDSRIKIGILQYTSVGALDSAREGIIEAFYNAGYSDKDIVFINRNPQAETTTLGNMSKDLLRQADLIIGIATPAAISLVNEAKNNNINKPILFTAVTDPVAANLVASNEAPGGNVTGTNDMNPVAQQIALAKELMPTLSKIGIVYTSSEVNSQLQVNLAKEKATELGISVETATITSTNEIQQITRSLITNKGIELLYIPTDNLVSSAMSVVSEISKEFNIPTVCGEASMIDNGGLITLGIDYKKLGVLTGEMAIKILKGEKTPATFPVASLTEFDLVVNKKAASEIGFTIPQAILDRAKTVIE
jgi:putative ABC transport system substrate-binding protein